MDWTTALAAGGPVAGVFLLVSGFYYRIRRANQKLAQTEAETNQKAEEAKANAGKAQRKDLVDGYYELIERLQLVIKGHDEDIATIRAEHREAMDQCQNERDEATRHRSKMETLAARAMERIEMLEQYLRARVKGWNMPPFKRDLDDGSTPHPPVKE